MRFMTFWVLYYLGMILLGIATSILRWKVWVSTLLAVVVAFTVGYLIGYD